MPSTYRGPRTYMTAMAVGAGLPVAVVGPAAHALAVPLSAGSLGAEIDIAQSMTVESFSLTAGDGQSYPQVIVLAYSASAPEARPAYLDAIRQILTAQQDLSEAEWSQFEASFADEAHSGHEQVSAALAALELEEATAGAGVAHLEALGLWNEAQWRAPDGTVLDQEALAADPTPTFTGSLTLTVFTCTQRGCYPNGTSTLHTTIDLYYRRARVISRTSDTIVGVTSKSGTAICVKYEGGYCGPNACLATAKTSGTRYVGFDRAGAGHELVSIMTTYIAAGPGSLPGEIFGYAPGFRCRSSEEQCKFGW